MDMMEPIEAAELKKLHSCISQYAGKRLTIWGCGYFGKRNAENMSIMGIEFEITDANAKIHGESVANAVVKPWDELKESTDVVLVSAKGIFDEVNARLSKECPDIKVVDLMKENIPHSVAIDASTLCQLNCKSCYMRKSNSGIVGKGYLKSCDFENFILKHKFVTKIELSNNGEIFLNPDLVDILKYAFENNIELTANNSVNFNTVSDGVIEALVAYNFKSMTISIDGASQEVYCKYRVNGNFDTVISNIKKLNHFKNKYNTEYPKLVWQYIIMEHNENDVSKAKEMAKELGMEIKFKLTWDLDYIPKNADMLKKETGLEYLTRNEMLANKKIYSHLCHQLWESPQINYDGRLLGCCGAYLDDFGVNVFEVGIERAINSANYILAKKMLKGEIDVPENTKNIPCANCSIYKTMKKEGIFIHRK
jgi:MoaA/NifB/PqqE/SkfB family radical SAM enzyme